ncbi:MAG: hypothetical protein ABEH64_12580 [Salinirussus sp.]
MDAPRAIVLSAAAIMIVMALATGPAGPLTIPLLDTGQPPGTGSAAVTIVAEPGQPIIDQGRQGSDVRYLRVPDIGIEVRDLHGNPTLTYTITVPALDYSRSSIHFLGQAGEGRHAVGLTEDALGAGRLGEGPYTGRLELVLRDSQGTRTIYSASTVVEVVD